MPDFVDSSITLINHLLFCLLWHNNHSTLWPKPIKSYKSLVYSQRFYFPRLVPIKEKVVAELFPRSAWKSSPKIKWSDKGFQWVTFFSCNTVFFFTLVESFGNNSKKLKTRTQTKYSSSFCTKILHLTNTNFLYLKSQFSVNLEQDRVQCTNR